MTADGLIECIWRQSCRSWRSTAGESVSDRRAEKSLPNSRYSLRSDRRDFKALGTVREVTLMPENPLEIIERLETLAAWHRINAEHAGADWVWEARLRTAEDLERLAAEMRRNRPVLRQRKGRINEV